MAYRQPSTSSSLPQEDDDPLGNSRKRKGEAHVKRPMNPFMIWCQKKRGDMLKSHPGMKPSEISRQLGEGWRNLTDQEKSPFYDEAERLKAEYEKVSTSPRKSADHVKRPMNPFMIWCRQKRGELLKSQPGMKPSDISKQLGEGWKSMSDEQKRPFCEEAERLKYEHEKNYPDYKFQPQKKEKRAKKTDPKRKPNPHHPTQMLPTASSSVPGALQAFQLYSGLAGQLQNPSFPTHLVPSSYDTPLNIAFGTTTQGSQQPGPSNAPGPSTNNPSYFQ